ncbi:ribosomal RNA-processing protein 8 [Opisthocomus hoazin]|uniref:ribosomal RNA-processing protein 8 n=1 Tax=Opisthocomus hoazin TaxID=30419 RepID=UPI003F53726F
MFAEEEWNDGAQGPPRARPGPRGAPEGPGPPAPAAAGKRRRRRAAGDCAAEPGGPARKRPRERRRAEGQRPGGGASARPARPGPGERQGAAAGEAAAPGGGRSAALRARMEERLLGARFRYLNEQLYTCSSRDAARLFRADPDALRVYHRGFARQVGRWPEHPVRRIVRYLRRRPASLVVADFGCGDCELARSVRNKVHCFDLAPLSPRVTVCDMAEVPLPAESVDIAVFCLALMGTNLQEILEEANRVLKQGGTLLVAEVASRFEDIRAFLNAMAQLGFRSVSKDLSSAFFFLLEFAKTGPPHRRPAPGLRLRPCLYKRR